MTFLGFILIVAVGIGVPAIVLELLSPMRRQPAEREQRASVSTQAVETAAAAIPAFFARPPRELRPMALGFDESILAFLQNHVKAERAVADEFVHYPSVDSLYARPSLTMH